MSEETKIEQMTPAADPALDRDRWLSAMADMESRHDIQMEAIRRRLSHLEGRHRGFSLTEEEKLMLFAVGSYVFVTVLVPVIAAYVRRWTQQTQS